MVKWYEDEAKLSRQRRASVVGGVEGNEGRGGIRKSRRKSAQGSGGRVGNRSRRETAVDESRKYMANRVQATRPTSR